MAPNQLLQRHGLEIKHRFNRQGKLTIVEWHHSQQLLQHVIVGKGATHVTDVDDVCVQTKGEILRHLAVLELDGLVLRPQCLLAHFSNMIHTDAHRLDRVPYFLGIVLL